MTRIAPAMVAVRKSRRVVSPAQTLHNVTLRLPSSSRAAPCSALHAISALQVGVDGHTMFGAALLFETLL